MKIEGLINDSKVTKTGTLLVGGRLSGLYLYEKWYSLLFLSLPGNRYL